MIKIKTNYILILSLFFVLSYIIFQIFAYDLNYYGVPSVEIRSFYLYSFGYTILGIFISLIIGRLYSKNSVISQIPYSLNLILGCLWILDGVLQFQPQMPYGFLTFVIQPSIMAIPETGIQNFLYIGYSTWALHPFQFDALSGALQVFIGFSFLTYRSRSGLKLISIISIFWALIIWIFGEGLGGIPVYGVSLLTGFPGSALLYILMAVPYLQDKFEHKSVLHEYFRNSLLVLVGISIILQLLPFNSYWTSGIFSQIIYNNTFSQGESLWMYIILESVWPLLIFHTAYINILFSLILVSLFFLLLSGNKTGDLIGMVTVSIFWILFQNLGIYQNPATDFNSGLLLVLIFYINSFDSTLSFPVRSIVLHLTEKKIR